MKAFVLVALLFASSASAGHTDIALDHGGTPSEIEKAIRANQLYHERFFPQSNAARPFRPVEDTANFAYVLMSGYDQGESEVANLRETIARNLPDSVKLVILADTSDAGALRQRYLKWIPANRLIMATDISTEGGFWARDSFPIPVYDNALKAASLVSANYYREFPASPAVAKGVHGAMAKKDFTFVGGNLLADEDGNCFSVDSYRMFSATPSDLIQAFGCKAHHLMKHVRGLGDVDEVLKPLPGKRMLTNSPEYKADLESWGYSVILLPTSPEKYRTYVNSLVVGKAVFMPSYDVAQDLEAQQVYESLGFHVFPITTITLSDVMNGSVHCQTMAYPPMPQATLLKGLGLVEVR